MQLKTSKSTDPFFDNFWDTIASCMFYASKANVQSSQSTLSLLDELYRAAFQLVKDVKDVKDSRINNNFRDLRDAFLSLAIYCDLYMFVKGQLDGGVTVVPHAGCRDLLVEALEPKPPIDGLSAAIREGLENEHVGPSVRFIELLLEHGAVPNRKHGDSTIWSIVVDRALEIRMVAGIRDPYDENRCRQWLEIIAAFIHGGAQRTYDIDRMLEINLLSKDAIRNCFPGQVEILEKLLKEEKKDVWKRFKLKKQLMVHLTKLRL
jgi:hypothetical protein